MFGAFLIDCTYFWNLGPTWRRAAEYVWRLNPFSFHIAILIIYDLILGYGILSLFFLRFWVSLADAVQRLSPNIYQFTSLVNVVLGEPRPGNLVLLS